MRRHRWQEERGGLSLGLVAGMLVAGALLAVPIVLMSRQQAERGEQALGQLELAQDVGARAELDIAMRAAQVYFAQNDTFVGFSPQVASSFEPSTSFNTSPAAVEGQVSIRGLTPTTVVLVTLSPSGTPICAAAEFDTVTYASTDAQNAAQCV